MPRLTPEYSVRTTTSPGPGSGSATGRISPRPGAAIQKARADPGITTSSSVAGAGQNRTAAPYVYRGGRGHGTAAQAHHHRDPTEETT